MTSDRRQQFGGDTPPSSQQRGTAASSSSSFDLMDIDPSTRSSTSCLSYAGALTPRPRSTEPASTSSSSSRPRTYNWYSYSASASEQTIADLRAQLTAATQQCRSLTDDLAKATQHIVRLYQQRREANGLLDRSESRRRAETRRADRAFDTARQLVRRYFERAAATIGPRGDVYLSREELLALRESGQQQQQHQEEERERMEMVLEPCARCERTEKEARSLRLQLGHANQRIEAERNASHVIAAQAENYQALVAMQHREIRQLKARVENLFGLMDRLQLEKGELLAEKAAREEMERKMAAATDLVVDDEDGEKTGKEKDEKDEKENEKDASGGSKLLATLTLVLPLRPKSQE
ncbi:hypothetical protein GGR53DRAFT_465057 [Hypoxylon sp. FL1150]|nr:hypothetical protein GGR53DRAFT_465057 [Hypoxylon sp. FL1150]